MQVLWQRCDARPTAYYKDIYTEVGALTALEKEAGTGLRIALAISQCCQ